MNNLYRDLEKDTRNRKTQKEGYRKETKRHIKRNKTERQRKIHRIIEIVRERER